MQCAYSVINMYVDQFYTVRSESQHLDSPLLHVLQWLPSQPLILCMQASLLLQLQSHAMPHLMSAWLMHVIISLRRA